LVFVAQVVGIARYDARNIEFLTEFECLAGYGHLLIPLAGVIFMPMILNFQIVAIAKDFFVPTGGIFGLVVLTLAQAVAYLTTNTAT
jgi:hypothetical protein